MSLKLMQWNCMYSENPDKVADYIKEIGPDVVCLQELTQGYHGTTGCSGERIANRLGYYGHFAYGPMALPDGENALMGNGIISRTPFIGTDNLTLAKGGFQDGKVVADERIYLQVTINANGREVTVATTHLPFHPQFKTTPVKMAMVEQILAFMPQGEANYVLAADLNATPYVKSALELRRRAGLKNAGPALIQKTWTTKPFTIGPWSYNALDWRLDYVLYKGGLRPRNATILQTELSDHLPILVEFDT